MIPSTSKNTTNLRQPKPIRGSLNSTQRNQSRFFDSLKRPSNPIIKDVAFSRVNSERTPSIGEELDGN
jgi:hypothetical protein